MHEPALKLIIGVVLMNSKGHLFCSVAKSAMRIISCIVTLYVKDINVMVLGFLGAEVLGVAEELFDKR